MWVGWREYIEYQLCLPGGQADRGILAKCANFAGGPTTNSGVTTSSAARPLQSTDSTGREKVRRQELLYPKVMKKAKN
jgi:hypothetical protein